MIRQISSNGSKAMTLRSVKVEGADKTRTSFLGFLINPILAQSSANDLDSVLYKTRHIADTLQRTDIFRSVVASIESSRDPMAEPSDVDLILKTRERGRIFINSSTQFGNSDVEGVGVRAVILLHSSSSRVTELHSACSECLWWWREP